MTEFEAASLITQWLSAGAAMVGVLVAAVFGYLTLVNNRRSKDAQDRASVALETDTGLAASLQREFRAGPTVRWKLEHTTKNNWQAVNEGPGTAYDVQLRSVTEQDARRVVVADQDLREIGPYGRLSFTIRPLAGAADAPTVVLSWTYEGESERYEAKLSARK